MHRKLHLYTAFICIYLANCRANESKRKDSNDAPKTGVTHGQIVSQYRWGIDIQLLNPSSSGLTDSKVSDAFPNSIRRHKDRRFKRTITLLDEDFNIHKTDHSPNNWRNWLTESDGSGEHSSPLEEGITITAENDSQHKFSQSHQGGDTDFPDILSPANLTPEHTQESRITDSETDRIPTFLSTNAKSESPITSSNDVQTLHQVSATFTSVPVVPFLRGSCLDSVCIEKELEVYVPIAMPVVQHTALGLTCHRNINNTKASSMHWIYLNNGEHKLLASTKDDLLTLLFNKTEVKDSGIYKCVVQSDDHPTPSCCYKEIRMVIYEMPNYKTHLLLIGCITGASVLTCGVLVILRKRKHQKYTDYAKCDQKNKESAFLT